MKCIYKIINKENGKFYLGSAENCHKRQLRHFRDLRKGRHHNLYLQRAWNKYGEKSFSFEFIQDCNECKRDEQILLNDLDWNKCYNISSSASGGDLIKNHPNRDKIISRLTEQLLKAPKPESRYKEKNGNWKGGKTFCSCGARISGHNKSCMKCADKTGENNPFYGKAHTEETKSKLRDQRLGKYIGNQEKPVMIEGIEYKSVSEAGRALKVTPNTIINRIRNDKFPNYFYKTLTTIPEGSTLKAEVSGKAINPE